MVQPIQYQIPGALNPFENLVSGLKLGATMADMDAARAQQQAATQLAQQKALAEQAQIAQQQQYQAGLNAFFAKPPAERSIEELQPLLVGGNKEQFEALKSIGDRMSADQLASSKKFTGQVLVSLESNPESAKQILRQRAEVEKDPMQKKAWEDTLKLAETSPEQAAKSVELLGAGVFGKDWYDSISNVRKERREASKTPFELRTAEAGARKAEAEAGVVEATRPFKISEASSTSIIKAAEAALAPEKFLTDLGLTKAQIDASKAARRASDAAAAKSGAEATRARAEANQMAAGVIPVDKRPEAETKFRTEYNNQTKPFQEVKSAYGRVLASEDTAVGDLSLIFGYMKMLDPGSVVREGEFATAQNAAGVPERIQNIYNKIISGERLNQSQRSSFKGQAEKLYTAAGQQESNVRSGIERIAKGYGLNTSNIFYSPTEKAPTAQTVKVDVTQIPTKSTPGAAPTRNISVNY